MLIEIFSGDKLGEWANLEAFDKLCRGSMAGEHTVFLKRLNGDKVIIDRSTDYLAIRRLEEDIIRAYENGVRVYRRS